MSPVSLVERLGHPADARLVIINADELGLTRASNVGVFDALRHGAATSASLMVPAPWARDAAAGYRGEDVGVHLTFNAEWDTYRWGPISHSPSLRDGDGGFPRTTEDLWDHGDMEELRKEGRAQIERAIFWGFDVSHVDSHIGALLGRPEFFDVYLELALDFGLPLRLPGEATQRLVGFPFRKLAAEEGAIFPDHLVAVPREGSDRVGARRAAERALFDLEPGVTEIQTHPAIDTDELRAACPDWPGRVEDHAYLRDGSSLLDLVDRAGATLIGHRDLRDLARSETP